MLTAICRYGPRVLPDTRAIVRACRERGELIEGPEIRRFERAFAERAWRGRRASRPRTAGRVLLPAESARPAGRGRSDSPGADLLGRAGDGPCRRVDAGVCRRRSPHVQSRSGCIRARGDGSDRRRRADASLRAAVRDGSRSSRSRNDTACASSRTARTRGSAYEAARQARSATPRSSAFRR